MILHKKGYSAREMEGPIGRHHSTISRELKRNSVKGKYLAQKAEIKAYQRRHQLQKQLKKIRLDEELEGYIRNKLKELRSPQRIAGCWSKNNPLRKVSHVTIYKYIYSTFGSGLGYYLYTQRHKCKRRKNKKNKRSLIPQRVWIDARPKIVELRLEAGHYECDLIVSKKGCKTVILTIIDMLTRKSMAWVLTNKSPTGVIEKLVSYIDKNNVKSITFDNGIEFMYHYKLGIPTYFCHPYSSREKGQIERRNRDYRWVYKKGSSLSRVTQKHLDATTKRINNTPMICLGYRTPHEIFTNYYSGVAFDPLM